MEVTANPTIYHKVRVEIEINSTLSFIEIALALVSLSITIDISVLGFWSYRALKMKFFEQNRVIVIAI